MSTFSVAIEVGSIDGSRWEPVEVIVDTGATFAVLPRDTLRRLGVQPLGTEPFGLGDGRVVRSEVGEARIRLEEKERTVTVIFGEPGEPNLLGTVTLETFLLAADPVHRTLVPVEGVVYQFEP